MPSGDVAIQSRRCFRFYADCLGVQRFAGYPAPGGTRNGLSYHPNRATLSIVKVSVIIASGREATAVRSCVDSLLCQESAFDYEVILAGSPIELDGHLRLKRVVVDDLNPAVRRNRAAAIATAENLAFIDDDAVAAPDWLCRGVGLLESDRTIVAVGGPDPAPDDSTVPELISDTLLSAPWIGSGVMCHEGPEGMFEVRSPHDLALVNLFVKREEFASAGGFDETIGYIGEDSDLLARLLERGRVVYSSSLVVRHRRRSFPFDYIRQRWRYRVKMGESLLQHGSLYRSSSKIWMFLGGGALFILLVALAPLAGIVLFLLYVVATLIAGTSATRLRIIWWPVIPFAFMIHHATYFAGITWGIVKGIASRLTEPRKHVATETKDR